MTNFDEILDKIGNLGWFQIRAYIFVCFVAFGGSLMTFAQVFVAGTNDHWCKVSQWEHENCSQFDLNGNECVEFKRNLSTPIDGDDDDFDPMCMKHNLTGISLSSAYDKQHLLKYLEVINCDEGWSFHHVFTSTITEDWELVCDKSAVPNILQSVYLTGVLLGCIVFGALSDRIGRFYTIGAGTVLSGVFGILCVISTNVIVFAILRFIVGGLVYGTSLISFVYSTELVRPETRVYFGVALWYLFAVAYFVLSAVGRYVPNWRIQLVILAIPYLILSPFVIFLTESPRWLLSKKKYSQAEKVVRKIAKVNKRDPPDKLMSKLMECNEGKSLRDVSYLDIIRHPVLLCYFLNLIFNWFVQSFVYYGLSLGTSSLGVNVYVAFCISGAVEIPAYTVSIFTMKYLGRKLSTGSLMILAGIACFATILAPLGPVRVTFAMIGKFAITASFANIYVHTAEIFPTPLRGLGVGSCSISARLGGVIAPLILVFQEIWEPLPLVLFASSSFVAGVLVFLLPETRGKPMPDTIEESVALKSRKYVPVVEDTPAWTEMWER